MISDINLKRLKFLLNAVLLACFTFYSGFVSTYFKLLFTAFLVVVSFFLMLWSLQIEKYPKKTWFFSFLLPLHLIIGLSLVSYGFPNLSLLFKLIFITAVSALYYITFLVLNIFMVVEKKDRPIPLYRAAVTWAQILIVIASILVFAGMFKLPVDPLLQVFLVSVSAFLLTLLFLWVIDLESGFLDLNLALLSAFWIQLMALSILFLPLEALFRGLFLSSVLLFGMGYAIGYVKHNLTTKAVIDHLIIIVAFLFISLLFLP